MSSSDSTENSSLIDQFLSPINFYDLSKEWRNAKPMNHIVIDDFLKSDIIDSVVSEFPNYENETWRIYDNALENKQVLNYWDKFGLATYRLFTFFCSATFVEQLEVLTGHKLFADIGLNGGGLHTHNRRGHSNLHRDYSIHPKLKLERKLNLLIYVTPSWEVSWGGELQLWSVDKKEPCQVN
jgi:Rps23 Pro-64 3,4-dihydroxylase Tpa1-like proline 4-hydroxylase